MASQFSENEFKSLFAIILSQAKNSWISPSELSKKINDVLIQNNITGINLPNIYVYNNNYSSYIEDLWQLYKRKYIFISTSSSNYSNPSSVCNDVIRIDDVRSEIDIRKKTSQLLAKIEEVDIDISSALNKAESLKTKSKEKHEAGWSFGGKDKRLAIEALQSVTRDMADSQEEIIKIQKKIVDGQKMLNQHTTILYQLGAMSLSANRMVHRELKLKLENASREELSELARQELLNTIQQIEQMQDTLIIQEKQKVQLNQQTEKISKLERDNDRLRCDMTESDSRFSTQADSQNKEIAALNSAYKSLHNDIIQNKENNIKDIRNLKNEINQQFDRLQKLLNSHAVQLKQDEELISEIKEDIAFLHSGLSEIESKCSSQSRAQNNNISDLQNALHLLTANISTLVESRQKDNDSISAEIDFLKKNSYSKNKVWLLLVFGVLLSVILSVIGVMSYLVM